MVYLGWNDNPNIKYIIEYVTISTLGNSQDFGDLTDARGIWSTIK